MKSLKLYILTLIIFQSMQSCVEPFTTSPKEEFCYFQTDGTGKSLGIKMKIGYPCTWQTRSKDHPGMVQQFYIPDGKFGLSLFINDLPLGSKLDKETMEAMMKEMGTVVSVKDIKIKGRNVIETMVEGSFESPMGIVYSNLRDYSFLHNGKAISFGFSSESENKEEAANLLVENKELFNKIISETIIF